MKNKYDSIKKIDDNYSIVELYNKFGIIDKYENITCEIKYDTLWYYNFNGNIAIIELNQKFGIIDIRSGSEICVPKYDIISPFICDLSLVKLNNKWGFINTNGEVVIELKYDNAWSFIDDFAKVGVNNKYGIINKRGELVIDLIYDIIEIDNVLILYLINHERNLKLNKLI
jgi:hypothetical protein